MRTFILMRSRRGAAIPGGPHCGLPILRWNAVACKALRFAMELLPEVYAGHVAIDEKGDNLERDWPRYVETLLTA